jgi:hypothetical protein
MPRETKMPANERFDPSGIPGWGVDADPQNDPTYPYRDRGSDPGLRADWERPPLQVQGPEILQSIEHIRRPAVFGTANPPSGLSGVLRRAAFRWSESSWLHWLLLMGADRLNVVEGVAEDVGRGKIPNVLAEMGAGAEWRHNKVGFVTKAAAALVITGGVILFLRQRGSGAGLGERRGL